MNRFPSKLFTLAVLAFSAVLLCAERTSATEISGTISATLTIFDDSKLVGDVTCAVDSGPCILIAASHIKLSLNGFTLAGTIAGCTPSTSTDDGIDVIGLSDVAIVGPGVIQGFGGFGIFLFKDTGVKIERVTVTDSCFSGIILVLTTDSDIERNVSVRNSMGSENGPCGGT